MVYDTLNSGLPTNSINDIAEDSGGNKWIATGLPWESNGGLVKFDGSNWTVYDTSNSDLPSNYITCIKIDDLDNKWIGTDGGLVKFDDTNWMVYNTSNTELPSNRIICIAIDNSGNKWIGTPLGLAKFDGTNWTVIDTSNSGLPSNVISCIAVDEFNNKWIGTGGWWEAYNSDTDGEGLTKYDGTYWTIFDTLNSAIPSNDITCLEIDASGNKWIGTSDGFAKFDDTNWRVYNEANSGLTNNSIYCVTVDRYENKWIGTKRGLSVYNEKTVSVDEDINLNESIPNDYLLYQNYPNPFNPNTKIKYSVPQSSNVVRKVFDVLGNEIETLVNEEKPAGTYEITWYAENLPSGIYFYQLNAGEFINTKKMVLVK